MFLYLEKNPFTQRRSTAGQTGNKSGQTYPEAPSDPSKLEENGEEEESDDFDEFYNDKGFLNTGMNRSYEPMFGGMQIQDENNQLNRVSYNSQQSHHLIFFILERQLILIGGGCQRC